MFLSDDKGKLQLQAWIYTVAGLNLGLLLSHPRSSHLRVTVPVWASGKIALVRLSCWNEMVWTGSSCCHVRLDLLLGIEWEDTHTGYVGGNLCNVGGEMINLLKNEEKSGRRGWRRRKGSCHFLPCWYPLMLMACCKPSDRVAPFTRAGTCYRVSWGMWHCPLISLATMGPHALWPCLLYSDLQLSNDEKEKLQNLVHPLLSLSRKFTFIQGLGDQGRILKLFQTTRIKSSCSGLAKGWRSFPVGMLGGCRIEGGGQLGLADIYSRWWHVIAWFVPRLRGWSASTAGLVGLIQCWAAPCRFCLASVMAAPDGWPYVGAQGGVWHWGCLPCSAALGEGAV